jgi:protein-S-isoprenylcysteine O-methyltransferase Ste14
LAWRSWAAGIVKKGQVLTTVGPYALCRHPLYLGSFLVLTGFCLIAGNVVVALFLAIPFIVVHVGRIWREEEKMQNRFGEEWSVYAATVSWLLPRHWPCAWRAPWSRSQWLLNCEGRTILQVIHGVGLLLLVRFGIW